MGAASHSIFGARDIYFDNLELIIAANGQQPCIRNISSYPELDGDVLGERLTIDHEHGHLMFGIDPKHTLASDARRASKDVELSLLPRGTAALKFKEASRE